MLHFVTDFADQAVALPLVLTICVVVLAQGWRRGAAAWVTTIAATFALILALKLTFTACWQTFGTQDFRTPSGHVAAATAIAGGLGVLLFRRRILAVFLAIAVAALVSMTRVRLGYHSLNEVIVGAVVGLLGVSAMIAWAGRRPHLYSKPILATVVVVMVVFHGLHFPAEAHIRATAIRIAAIFGVCQP